MQIRKDKGLVSVALPDGRRLARSDLPPQTTKRWVASRKARVVLAVEAGLMTTQEVCGFYGLSQEEFDGWRSAVKSHGISGLKATKVQTYRQP